MLKFITVTVIGLLSLDLLACQCSKYVLDPWPNLEDFAQNHAHPRAELLDENVEVLRYYPTTYERLFASDFRDTSCGNEGPNGEVMFHCSHRFKADMLLKFPKDKCEMKVQVTSTYGQVKIKKLSSSCK
jgi:hypothetical protein